MTISIIIPTYNEAGNIGKLISYLESIASTEIKSEIIVVDGGSIDATVEEAKMAGAVVLLSPKKGRGAQMNFGAHHSRGEVLYFLHADSYPPENFYKEIKGALNNGFKCGCFRLSFDYNHWFLRLNAWFTRFDSNLIRFGDQSLFVDRTVFNQAGAFREDLIVMEDLEIIPRIRKISRFKVLRSAVRTSARKYLDNGIFKLQGIFFIIYFMYRIGFSQQNLVKVYRYLIRQNKY